MKNVKKQFKMIIAEAICKLAKSTAVKSANTTCIFYHHQPVLPSEVKNLRKF